MTPEPVFANRYPRPMEAPLISIGMPVFNGAEYLHEAITSLLRQTYGNFELLISDNASVDETEIICRRFAEADRRIMYFRQSCNFGASNNFQYVLDMANGRYFMWAAADDIWAPNWLESLLDIHLANPMITGAIGKVKIIDQDGLPIREYLPKELAARSFGWVMFREFTGEGGGHVIYGLHKTSYLKLDVLKISGKQIWNGWSMDIPYLLRYLTRGEIRSTSKTFYKSRDHISSVGKSLSRSRHLIVRLIFPVPVLFYVDVYRSLPGHRVNAAALIAAHFFCYIVRHYVKILSLAVFHPKQFVLRAYGAMFKLA